MIETEQNPSVQALTVQQRAQLMPTQYFHTISGRVDSTMQPALIFTADNLKNIKHYVHQVYRLPKTVEEIANGYDFSAIRINPDDISRHYDSLRTHADGWGELERQTKLLGGQLENFASEFTRQGSNLVQAVKRLGAYQSLTQRVGDIYDYLTLERTPFRELDSKDQAEVVILGEYLDFIKGDIAAAKSHITEVRRRAFWFTDLVVKQLRPENDRLKQLVKGANLAQRINDLRAQLEPLDAEIMQKHAEYSALVGYAFAGLVFGPIGVAITGGIFGPQAEQVRWDKNLLVARREVLTEELATLNPLIGAFERIALQIEDLSFRLTDVQTAAKNLEDIWSQMDMYVGTSQTEMQQINSDIKLATFIHRFERVVRPWEKIRGLSAQLSKIFNETIDEISKEGAY